MGWLLVLRCLALLYYREFLLLIHPFSLTFVVLPKTEPRLGLEMLTDLAEQDLAPFCWVAADEHYGMNPAFLDGVDRLGKWYFAECRSIPYKTLTSSLTCPGTWIYKVYPDLRS
jgi:hypothetical protein